MNNPYKRASAKKFDWSMEEISKTPMRRRWKRSWKHGARKIIKREARIVCSTRWL